MMNSIHFDRKPGLISMLLFRNILLFSALQIKAYMNYAYLIYLLVLLLISLTDMNERMKNIIINTIEIVQWTVMPIDIDRIIVRRKIPIIEPIFNLS